MDAVSGAFKGAFSRPVHVAPRGFFGVFVQSENYGAGTFDTRAGGAGKVEIKPK
jgi:hypothetical protein